MAKVLDPLSDNEVNKMTVVNLRTAYKKLADFYSILQPLWSVENSNGILFI